MLIYLSVFFCLKFTKFETVDTVGPQRSVESKSKTQTGVCILISAKVCNKRRPKFSRKRNGNLCGQNVTTAWALILVGEHLAPPLKHTCPSQPCSPFGPKLKCWKNAMLVELFLRFHSLAPILAIKKYSWQHALCSLTFLCFLTFRVICAGKFVVLNVDTRQARANRWKYLKFSECARARGFGRVMWIAPYVAIVQKQSVGICHCLY